MSRLPIRFLLALIPCLTFVCLLTADQTRPGGGDAPGTPNLTDYRTVATAVTTTITPGAKEGAGKTGFLGVTVMMDDKSRLIVEGVQQDSPADKAGVKQGDVVTHVGGHAVGSPASFREWLQTLTEGETVKLGLNRLDKAIEVSATLIATSRPLSNKGGAGGKGGEPGKKGGDPAKKGDDPKKKSDDPAKKGDEPGKKGDEPGKGGQAGKGGGAPPLWTKPLMRLAVVGIEFSDVKHNDKVSTKEWADAILSKGAYNKKNATDQAVFGSLNDYFIEQSSGAFKLEGKVFDWVAVSKKRADYIQGTGTSNKTQVLNDALNKLAARDGKDALKNFDAIMFVYAGDRYKTNAGAVYYPHAASITFQDQRYSYFITPEGGEKMTPLGGYAKPAGLALGLPDLAARTENIGSRGLGAWCALSNTLTDARPQHFNPWAKEKLGWIKPVAINPTVKQKLILSPIEDSAKECVKVLVRLNGSEYYLLENRRKKGFDSGLPAEGLLVWRVVNDRPTLVESHGVDSPTGPQIHLNAVPYPSEANTAFAPDTVPSSRSPLGGGLPVHITEIRQLADGRIAFCIGYEYR